MKFKRMVVVAPVKATSNQRNRRHVDKRINGKDVDGYDIGPALEGFYPAEEFHRLFTPAENMTFGEATEALKNGEKINRKAWVLYNYYVAMIGDNTMELRTDKGHICLYVPSGEDIFAEDWCIV